MGELKVIRPRELVMQGRHNEPVYLKSEVDKVIAEKNAEIAELKAENERLKEGKKDYKQFYQDTFKELESLKATHYAESVDAGMRERRLRRALYKACANWAKVRQRAGYFSWTLWGKMKDKCLNKMEEYK